MDFYSQLAIRGGRWQAFIPIKLVKQQPARRIPAARQCPGDAVICAPGRRGRRECRVFCAPAASRTKVESTRVSHHRSAEQSGIPCATVLTISFVLSLECRA